jgi:hypothetical protein
MGRSRNQPGSGKGHFMPASQSYETEADHAVRALKVDQYVNTTDGLTGYIFEDNGGYEDSRPYRIAICERDEERSVSASEVSLWIPEPGDNNSEPVWSE